MRALAASLAAGLVLWLGACAECAGTPSCTGPPFISYGGQLINHRTGVGVGGVTVEFTRRGGIVIDANPVRVVSDDQGFFTLRVGSAFDGTVTGDLTVTPPAPNPPYTVPDIQLSTARRRGDGGLLGRFVVDPYLIIVGEVYDFTTETRIQEGTVRMRRLSGGLISPAADTTELAGGRFGWVDPQVLEPGPVEVEFSVRVPGDARTFRAVQTVPMQYRDGTFAFVVVNITR